MKKFLLLVFLFVFSCQEKQENYKEIKIEVCNILKSKESLARLIKMTYPENYTRFDDSILIQKVLKEYPHLEKLKECHDLNLKMELIKKFEHKGNTIYDIYYSITLSPKENNIWIVPSDNVVIQTKNKVKLFDLCKSCNWEWRSSDKIYRLDGKKTIESIDFWNKIDSVKLEEGSYKKIEKVLTEEKAASLELELLELVKEFYRANQLEIYRVNEFGDEDPNGKYWVNQFGDEITGKCIINPKTGDCITITIKGKELLK